MEIKLVYVECLRCGHKWLPRVTDPRACARCKNPYWDRPRVRVFKDKPTHDEKKIQRS